jgi:spermidine synthase
VNDPWSVLDRALAPSGEELVLRRSGSVFEIRCNGWELMSTRAQHSEQELARLGCAGLGAGARVLIGGLGLGYTLQAALDALPATARVTVAELFAAVVRWNRGPLAALAGRPLEDPRVVVRQADVAALLAPGAFEAILLDTDNGPEAPVLAGNAALYGAAGVRGLRGALAPGGRLAVWSADRSSRFEARLAACGLAWECREVAARGRPGDPRHALYIARPVEW